MTKCSNLTSTLVFGFFLILIVLGFVQGEEEDDGRSKEIIEVRRRISDVSLNVFEGGEGGTRCNFAGTIVFASPFSLEQSDQFFVLGSSQLVGYQMVVDHVNRVQCGIQINEQNYAIELRTYDDQSLSEYSQAIGEYLVDQNDVDILLGGYSSGLTEPLAAIASSNSRLLLSPGAATTSVFAGRNSVFGTQPPSEKYIVQAIEGLAATGAKTIATVWEDASFTRGICSSAPDLANENGLTVTSTQEVPASPSIDAMQVLAEKVALEDPDVVVTCVYDQGCESWMQALRNINWSPRAQVFTVCVGFQEFIREFESDAQYIMGVTPWDSSLKIQDAVTGWSARDFGERYLAETADEDVKYQAASAAAVISIAIQAIESTNSLNDTILAEYIATNTFQTIYGEISFDENGQSKAPASMIQYDTNGTVQSVYPLDTASGTIMYPIPTWDQRDCKLSVCESEGDTCSVNGTCICSIVGDVSVGTGKAAQCIPEEDMNYINNGVLIFGYFLFGLVMTMCIGCLVWVRKYRTNPLVKVSQPLFMVLLVLGSMISTFSIIPLGVDTAYRDSDNIKMVDAACMAVPWLWGIGFGIIFSAIFAKVQRVKKIYDAGMAMKREPVLVRDVLAIMFIVVICEVVILTTWQMVSPHRWEREVISDIDGYSVESIGQCTSENGWWFFLALVAFNVLCLIYAIVLCFKTKHLPSEFAESSHIFLTVMFMLQILLLAVPVSAMVQDQTQVFYFLRVFVIFLQNFTVLIIIFVPKMLRVYRKDDALDIARRKFVTSYRRSNRQNSETNAANGRGVDMDRRSSRLDRVSELSELQNAVISSEAFRKQESNAPLDSSFVSIGEYRREQSSLSQLEDTISTSNHRMQD